LINGLYLATSGMNVEQKRMDILSNNLANINSTGFKKEKVVFEVFKDRAFLNLLKKHEIGNLTGGVIIGQTLLDMGEGTLKQTGNPLDFAASGMSFFVVNTPDGLRYTKNGAFKLNEDGYLTTQEGYYVQGRVGNILLNDANDFYVDETGDIYANNAVIDSIRTVSVANDNDLLMVGNSYFVLREGMNFAEGVPIM
jgi:flagellar basal-body rod protein FlgF